ncbi:MAG: hypothetical protein SGARI_004051 [Bacillariaceae sp.]
MRNKNTNNTTSIAAPSLDETFLSNIKNGYIKDNLAEQKENIQRRQFLRSDVRPVIGQRVDVCIQMKDTPEYTPGPYFNLSGQVVRFRLPETTLATTQRPMRHCEDRGLPSGGSMNISGCLVPLCFESKGERCPNPHCQEIHMVPDITKPAKAGTYCHECRGMHFSAEEWQNCPPEIKDRCLQSMKVGPFAIHGQEIVCEARLHFTTDFRRGSEEGPWGDGIPVDGRDVWSFVLQFNDAMENMWILKPETLRNMGRDRRPRCWPWSNETELPPDLERDGVDRFHTDYNVPVYTTMCTGPFGCVSEHEHGIGAGMA